jgi:hypothetical protein
MKYKLSDIVETHTRQLDNWFRKVIYKELGEWCIGKTDMELASTFKEKGYQLVTPNNITGDPSVMVHKVLDKNGKTVSVFKINFITKEMNDDELI